MQRLFPASQTFTKMLGTATQGGNSLLAAPALAKLPKLSQGLQSGFSPSFKGLCTWPARNFTASAIQYAPPEQAVDLEAEDEVPEVGETEWKYELANSLSIIGRLGRQAEIKQTPKGAVCNFAVAVNTGKNRPAIWLDVEAWGDLGQSAGSLRKGEQVHVLGKMVRRYPNMEADKERANQIKLQANTIDRISNQGYQSSYDATAASQEPIYDSTAESQVSEEYAPNQMGQQNFQQSSQASFQQNSGYRPNPAKNAQWEHFLAHRDEYWDNSTEKRNPKAPDYKHKSDKNIALWLNSAPPHVLQQLNKTPQ